MKKLKREEPSAASLRELPEVELARYRVRRNPYAARIAREGRKLVHEGPRASSLADIPEPDFDRVHVRRNPYASRAAEPRLQYGRGRPPRGEETGGTSTRSLRLPAALWKELEALARERQTTVHALVREVIVAFVQQARR
jgi:hypothetical protein